MIERQDFATDKDFEDAYYSNSMIDKQIEDNKPDEADTTETSIVERYSDEILKAAGGYCLLEYDSLKYKLRLLYREAEERTLKLTDRNYHANIIPAILAEHKSNITTVIFGLEDIFDNIEGNGDNITSLDITRLGNIILKLKTVLSD
jgi:hypothetical protein